MLYDITPTISPRLGVWPGDTPCLRTVITRLEDGDLSTLSSLTATAHLGAHADAPCHYDAQGQDIASRSLEFFLGPCQVVDVRIDRGERFGADHLGSEITETRILFRTGTFPDPEHWNDDFAGIEPALVERLASLGVRTIGIDTPSVDLQSAERLIAHEACRAHDISIIEGLALDGVPVGRCELIALPLKLEGFDASPLRAVLRAID